MKDALSEMVVSQLSGTSVLGLLVNLALCAVLASILAAVYVRYGHAISNRRAFARTFLVLTMTTMLIITIVQSSLALSLGLIGALSIVRFRAAIKEPEELAYLFVAIAVGLGLGAGQRALTLVAFVAIILAIRLRDLLMDDRDAWGQSAYLTVATDSGALDLEAIRSAVEAHASSYRLKRVDRAAGSLEAFFLLDFKNDSSFGAIEKALLAADADARITFLDHRGGSVATS